MNHLALAVLRPIVDEQSEAYKNGAIVGRITFFVIAALVLWKLVKWLRK